MIVLGLTGSIGMGKSTTAALFAEAGAVVWDADRAVHDLYAAGGAAAGLLGEAFPEARTNTGGIDREALAARIRRDPSALLEIERIVHPLVRDHRAEALDRARAGGEALVVLDIPLLFETGGDRAVDAVVVVSCSAEEQRRRVLARPGMTAARFEQFLARQTPDAEKRARADFVIDTGQGVEAAREQVHRIVATVTAPGWRRIPKAAETGQ